MLEPRNRYETTQDAIGRALNDGRCELWQSALRRWLRDPPSARAETPGQACREERRREVRRGALAPSYIAETIHANMPALAIVEPSNVGPLAPRARA